MNLLSLKTLNRHNHSLDIILLPNLLFILMKTKLYQVDAFTNNVFGGNPAAVCPLAEWIADDLMQNIAMETNLADTAFYVPNGNGFDIRWFTTKMEVALCGHATLATAHVLFTHENYTGSEIVFNSKSGELKVAKNGDWYTLDFPADTLTETEITTELTAGFNYSPIKAYKGKTDYILVFDSEDQIKTMQPDFDKIAKVDCRGIIVTAKGNEVDFVSRFFGPQSGLTEDPVTGSAHTSLTPYWAQVLGKTEFTAKQLSARGGFLKCKLNNSRVLISGQAKTFMQGELEI